MNLLMNLAPSTLEAIYQDLIEALEMATNLVDRRDIRNQVAAVQSQYQALTGERIDLDRSERAQRDEALPAHLFNSASLEDFLG